MIQLIYGGHIVNFFSMILDYPIPYMLVGFAGVFVKDHKITRKVLVLGGVFAGLLRYLSHFLAGVTFWRAYVPTEAFMGIKGFNAFTWSVFYNALYMVPSIFLSVQVLLGLYKYASHLLEDENPKDLLTIED
jgi:thiamine transporter